MALSKFELKKVKILQSIKTKSCYLGKKSRLLKLAWIFTFHKKAGQNKEWDFRDFKRRCDLMSYNTQINTFKYKFNSSFTVIGAGLTEEKLY